MTLGAMLSNLSRELVNLIQSTNDIVRKRQLRDELDRLHALVGQLVDANVTRATAEYVAATQGVEAGVAAIQDAERDIAKVAQTIDVIAKTLNALEQLAKKVAAA
jgi:uncharacterized protein YjiS (DUF1127 family)